MILHKKDIEANKLAERQRREQESIARQAQKAKEALEKAARRSQHQSRVTRAHFSEPLRLPTQSESSDTHLIVVDDDTPSSSGSGGGSAVVNNDLCAACNSAFSPPTSNASRSQLVDIQ
uniref:Uncharacterized protein n=1 Tax=Plectus sambesii TaxID=2011161 RepID=A0A914V677_9BILA